MTAAWMQKLLPRRKHVVIGIVILCLTVGLGYYAAIRSDAFATAERFANSNVEIRQEVGAVMKTSLHILDGFQISTTGVNGEARFVFDVRGEKKVGVLDVALQARAGVWQITGASISVDGLTPKKLVPEENKVPGSN